MAQGNFENGDYFIDSPGISQFALRAIFGVWINICIATIAICIRFIFRSQVKKRIISGQGEVSLWRISPAVTSSEVFELRGILARALKKGDYSFVFVSTFCVITAVVGAAGTVISNHVVETNIAVRDAVVQGRLVTNEHASISGALVQISARVDALTRANAPLAELFDFAPNDDSQWTYEPSQWNNTWKGSCSFVKHEAVELVVYPSNSTAYQDEVPLLGNYIPSWATVDRSKQGVAYTGFYKGALVNGTGAWRDMVVTYVFGSAPAIIPPGFSEQNTNISIVNYLAHHIARDDNGDSTYLETGFRSDVHTVDCQFVNAVDGGIHDQSHADEGSYTNAAGNVANMYNRAVVDASIAELSVQQPTGQEMLRYWQAFMSVKDAQYPHPVERTLSVRQGVVQVRLSFLVVTVGAFLLAILAATLVRWANPKNGVGRIHLPSSQLDWIVQAAREHVRYHAKPDAIVTPRDRLPTSFATHNQDLAFVITPDLEPRIATGSESLMPQLYYNK